MVEPTSDEILAQHSKRTKKVIYDDIKEEDWINFSNQVEEFLPKYGKFEDLGIKDLVQPEMNTDIIPQHRLNTIPIDHLWEVFSEIIMSSAYKNLPTVKIGGSAVKKGTKETTQYKISKLGYVIYTAKTHFKNSSNILDNDKQRVYEQIIGWYKENEENLQLSRVPSIDDSSIRWDEWIQQIQTHWRELRIMNQDSVRAKKQKTIQECIERRNNNFATKTRQTIKSILEIASNRVVLDHLVVEDDPAGIYVTDDPATIKTKVRNYFNDYHAERVCKPLEGRWISAYQPRDDINDQWFERLMDIPARNEILEAVKSAPSGKAPGMSGVTGDLLKHLGPIGTNIFIVLLQACIAQENMPRKWMQGMIYCIPKGSAWSGKISEVRPITLLEHGRKILFTILVNRLMTILSKHNCEHVDMFSH
jgi:hypothetical protein